MLASLADVNTHLPGDKFTATDGGPDYLSFQTDVTRLVKGYLSSVFSATTLAAWADPDSTPATIRAIAGRLVAAFYYAKKVSEDIPDWDGTYPQRLYDEAMKMLEMIRTGLIVLPEVPPDDQPGTFFDSSFFYPDSTDEPSFTMDMRW